MPDWTTMVNQVVIAGRPGDVRNAALGWEEVLGHVKEVQTSLETNVKDLATVWKGAAYEAFANHLDATGKELGKLVAQANDLDGIANSLTRAAERLAEAQARMPIPATAIGDVMAARNAAVCLDLGFCEAKLEASFYQSAPVKLVGWLVDQFRKILSDVEGEAAAAYDEVSSEYGAVADRTPAQAMAQPSVVTSPTTPNLTAPGAPAGPAGVPSIGDGAPAGGVPGAAGPVPVRRCPACSTAPRSAARRPRSGRAAAWPPVAAASAPVPFRTRLSRPAPASCRVAVRPLAVP
jgi:hypothetical protein